MLITSIKNDVNENCISSGDPCEFRVYVNYDWQHGETRDGYGNKINDLEWQNVLYPEVNDLIPVAGLKGEFRHF